MPLGRSRNKKNASSSSSSSYSSTITTIAFVAVCVLGVWMLTSNSIVPPQTTTRTAKITAATTTDSSSNNHNLDRPSNDNESTDQNKISQPAFEDNPGDLPLDAIKSDDPKSQVNDQNIDNSVKTSSGEEKAVDSQASNGKESTDETQKQTEEKTQTEEKKQVSEESNVIQKVAEENGEQSRDQNTQQNENGDVATTSLDSSNREANVDQNQDEEQGKQQQTQQQEQQEQEHEEEHEKQEENKEEQEKHEPELKQEPEKVESVKENPNEKAYEEQQEQRKEDAGIQMMTPDPRHEVSEEDNQERMKQQQQQERETQHQTPQPEQQQQQEQQQQPQQQQDQSQQEQQQPQQQQLEQHQFDDQTSPKKEEVEYKKPENETEVENQKKQQEAQGGESKITSDQETKNETNAENKLNGETSLPGMGTNAGIPKESKESKESWSTQAKESENQKERRKVETEGKEDKYGYNWELCNVTAGPDYIPCLDNEPAIKKLKSTKHFQHRERHCPQEGPTCLVPVPPGYKKPIRWPASRDKIWYHNVPHTLLAAVKGHQNWVKVTGEFLTFPGGGTQFIHGAMHYINFIQTSVPNIKWGKNIRVILDVGCGVASFGGYLFEKDVLTMSFAPKDEHEAQVQFALERGIPAISAVMGSQRLQFPSRVFDLIHCARCRVPWHEDGGMLLLELNRVLRPGGYFVWSATPVYQKLAEDVEIWKAMSALTVSMCWELVTIKKDKLNSVGAAIYRKPTNNRCYDRRKKNAPPMCESSDDANAAWYVPLHACMHRVPTEKTKRGYQWPENWPGRVETPPYWLNSSQMGIYGKPAPQDFTIDFAHWHNVVKNSYMKGLGISWSGVRNVMDMRAVYGGFAAALRDLKMWVINVVNVDSPDTLPIIFERGLFGMYHDWCESFSTYPRTYDLLHADHLFLRLKKRCRLAPVMAEVDRITRPGGKLIVRDESSVIGEVEKLLKSLRWEVHLIFSKDQEGLLSAQKGDWRPQNYSASPW